MSKRLNKIPSPTPHPYNGATGAKTGTAQALLSLSWFGLAAAFDSTITQAASPDLEEGGLLAAGAHLGASQISTLLLAAGTASLHYALLRRRPICQY